MPGTALQRLPDGLRLDQVLKRFGLVVVRHVPGLRERNIPEVKDLFDLEPASKIVQDLLPDRSAAVLLIQLTQLVFREQSL